MKRRSGQTFRQICIALSEASEGKNVAYVSQSQNAWRYYFDMAAKIAGSCLSDDVKIMQSSRSISFPSGGRLEFVSLQDIDMKRRGNTLSEHYDD